MHATLLPSHDAKSFSHRLHIAAGHFYGGRILDSPGALGGACGRELRRVRRGPGRRSALLRGVRRAAGPAAALRRRADRRRCAPGARRRPPRRHATTGARRTGPRRRGPADAHAPRCGGRGDGAARLRGARRLGDQPRGAERRRGAHAARAREPAATMAKPPTTSEAPTPPPAAPRRSGDARAHADDHHGNRFAEQHQDLAADCRRSNGKGRPGAARARRQRTAAGQARVPDRALRSGLHRRVRPELAGALSLEDAAPRRRAARELLRGRERGAGQRDRADQRPGTDPPDGGQLPAVHRPRAGHVRRRRTGARKRLRVPAPDAHARRSARRRRQDMEGLRGGHRSGGAAPADELPPPDARRGRSQQRSDPGGCVRDVAQPVRVLPLGDRYARVRAERRRAPTARSRSQGRAQHPDARLHRPRSLPRRLGSAVRSWSSPRGSRRPKRSCARSCRRSRRPPPTRRGA